MRGPTKRQREYLAYIQGFTDAHGYAPSRREIAIGLGVGSTNAVAYQLERLKQKGLVTWVPFSARTLRVTP